MALTRRDFLLALPLGAAAIGCGSSELVHGPHPHYAEIARAGWGRKRSVILICMPDTRHTNEVWTALADELARDFSLVAIRVEQRDAAAVIAEGVRRHQPSAIVLMNNPTVAAYHDYQRTSNRDRFPPAVIVMTSFLDRPASAVAAVTGISYEVPLITVVTNLRKLVASPLDRVGVVLRSPLAQFVQRQAVLARKEQILVSAQTVSNNPSAAELKHAIRKLKRHADAIWILNDDHLLTTPLIADGWLPGLDERPWIPTIVGAASLVSPQHSFGTFAILPDHTALGAQAADIVFDIADNDWVLPSDAEVQLPLSTTTIVDLIQTRERFALRDGALSRVDRIVE